MHLVNHKLASTNSVLKSGVPKMSSLVASRVERDFPSSVSTIVIIEAVDQVVACCKCQTNRLAFSSRYD